MSQQLSIDKVFAIDKVFSTRQAGPGEPKCPDGTFLAGYAMDSWNKWRVVCLSILEVEDVEDVFMFATIMNYAILRTRIGH